MRQKALVAKEIEYNVTLTKNFTRQAEVIRKLSGLSTQWENIQKRWDTLGQDESLRFSLAGATVLQWAAGKGLMEVVKQRLENGADVNASDQDGCTPLIAASLGGQFEVATLLIEHGAKIDALATKDVTALIGAAASGCVEVVQFLVDKGAD
ncbi:hypothetical protein M431DRAFT_76492, partial [Trichoderma harzianum CBS 226.95]